MNRQEAEEYNAKASNRLKMKAFKVNVHIVPTMVEVTLGLDKDRYEEREVWGFTLTDACRRANIVL